MVHNRPVKAVAFAALVLCWSLTSAAAPVSWSAASDGLWQMPANWSSNPNLPGSGDDVTIDRPGTINVTLSSGNQDIHSLTDQESLIVGGGTALTLAIGPGGAQINGAFTVSPGAVLRSYGAGTVVVSGPIAADGAGFLAQSGGKLLLPTLASYSDDSDVVNLQADGIGSKVDFSHVTTFSGSTNPNSAAEIMASNGGLFDLSSLTSLTTGATEVYASGAGSVVDLSSLTAFGANNQFAARRLQVDGGGKIISPQLTTFVNTGIGLGIIISGATSSIDLSHVTSFDSVNISTDSGGVFTPSPTITSYAYGSDAPTFHTNGVGSKIDLSHITSLTGASNGQVTFDASGGGLIDASALTSIVTGGVDVLASGNGMVDLSNLTTFAPNDFFLGLLKASDGGKIISPHLMTLGPKTTVIISGATSSIDLSHVTSFDSVNISTDSGGVFTPSPTITSYAYGSDGPTFHTDGVGSKIDLSHITSLAGASNGQVTLNAINGGLIDASALTSIATGNADVLASGTGAVIDLSNLSIFSGTNTFLTRRLRADNGGTIRIKSSGTTTVLNASVELDHAGTITGDTLELGAASTLSCNGILHANLINLAGITRPGPLIGSQEITGNFSQAAAGSLEVDIGGLTAGTQFDQVIVDGNATLGGGLSVLLANSLVPTLGQTFQILTASGTVSGTFSNVQLATLTGGLQWQVVYGTHSVTMKVINFYGDYNGDSIVDAADYVVWRDSLGTVGLNLAADGDQNGVVNQADYDFWRARFGQTSGSGSAAAQNTKLAAVPEPSTIAMLLIFVVPSIGRRRRR